jgi:hypothetical protein
MTNVVGALEGTRYPWPHAFSLLALATGMRQGELHERSGFPQADAFQQ